MGRRETKLFITTDKPTYVFETQITLSEYSGKGQVKSLFLLGIRNLDKANVQPSTEEHTWNQGFQNTHKIGVHSKIMISLSSSIKKQDMTDNS